jgi:hypothetical protein
MFAPKGIGRHKKKKKPADMLLYVHHFTQTSWEENKKKEMQGESCNPEILFHKFAG